MSPKSAWAESVALMSKRPVAEIEERWSERAGFLEYSGGLDRAEAERLARLDVEGEVLK